MWLILKVSAFTYENFILKKLQDSVTAHMNSQLSKSLLWVADASKDSNSFIKTDIFLI